MLSDEIRRAWQILKCLHRYNTHYMGVGGTSNLEESDPQTAYDPQTAPFLPNSPAVKNHFAFSDEFAYGYFYFTVPRVCPGVPSMPA